MDAIIDYDFRVTADTINVYTTATCKELCAGLRAGTCALITCGVDITPCIDEEAATDPSVNFKTHPVCADPSCQTIQDEELLELALSQGSLLSQVSLAEELSD